MSTISSPVAGPTPSTDVYEQIRRAALAEVEAGSVDLADRGSVDDLLVALVDDHQRSARSGRGLRSLHDPAAMVARLRSSLLDFGPLTPFFDGSLDYEELIVHGSEVAYIDGQGRMRAFDEPVTADEVRHVVNKLLASVGAAVDESRPMIQTQILDGSARIGVVVPPIAAEIDLTVRRYRIRREGFGELVAWDTLSATAASLLGAAMRTNCGVVVTGQPGAGKTTLVNALLRAVPAHRRIVACEDTPELSIAQAHAARWRTRAAGPDGSGEVTLRDLVRVSLGMRPDVIVVGEVRGPEAYELTRAGNAGCAMVSTIHANSARQGLQAMVSTAVMAGPNIDPVMVRHVFASIVDLVVHIAREPDGAGRRQVMEVVAVPAGQGAGVEATTEPILTRSDFGSPLEWTGARLPADLEQRLDRELRPLGCTTLDLLEGRVQL